MMSFKKNISGSVCCVVAAGLLALGSLTSCSDMLEGDSARQSFDPDLSQKTDSMFFALGILQGLQELADMYVFQGEMRGDLVETTTYTDNNLRRLADFSVTTANKYDSAYVFYKIINNCNYYIAHRDTLLRTGSVYVARNEYAAIKAIRAWTYMQLARVYGEVPFYTEPLTQISQIDNVPDKKDMAGIVNALAPDLEQYTGLPTPTFGGNTPNGSGIYPSQIFIPVDIVLGDMYLETNQYDKAATHYMTYLTQVAEETHTAYGIGSNRSWAIDWPIDWLGNYPAFMQWSPTVDMISYIPMARNSRQGTTTVLPLTFGYDFYATKAYTEKIQIVPSQSYLDLSTLTPHYYYAQSSGSGVDIKETTHVGDLRYWQSTRRQTDSDSDSDEDETTTVWITKYTAANVVLYRRTAVLLHLAEAFNRLDMPDAAFAILKEGINKSLIDDSESGPVYISEYTRQALKTTYPLLSTYASKFTYPTLEVISYIGVHSHGAGWTTDYNGDAYQPGLSPYQYDDVVGAKMAQLAADYPVGTTKQDTINAVEDLLCDEYALEFAFEGTRFYDLCRLARHKNAAGLYGADFGSEWLARKLAYKNPQKDLREPKNWYLPFK